MAGTADPRGLPPGYIFRPEYEIDAPSARRSLTEGALRLIDVRTADEWRTARVDGSEHVPLDELDAFLGEIEPDGTVMAFLCHHGVRSMRAALAARSAGFVGAVSVAGGIDAWSLGADGSVPRYERGPGGCRLV